VVAILFAGGNMTAYEKLGPWGRAGVDEFMALSQEQQKEVIATLIAWKYSNDVAGDLRDLIKEVTSQ
jgi:hypothetical protein